MMGKQLSGSLFGCAVAKSGLYGWSCAAIFLVCTMLTISIAMPAKYKEFFVWLMFCTPLLWCLWFCCIWAADDWRWLLKISLMWGGVNLAIILFILSFSNFSNWNHSKDGETIIGVLYFPIVLPLILFLHDALLTLLGNSATSISRLLGAGGGAYFIAMWCILSVLSILEGCCVFFLSKFFKRSRLG
jgi:hypothetical protein